MPIVNQFGKPWLDETVQRAEAVGPMVVQRLAVTTECVEIHAAVCGRRDLESGRIDDAVHSVGNAVRDHCVLGDAFDTLRIGDIDQLHVRPVERGEIFVVERRAFDRTGDTRV